MSEFSAHKVKADTGIRVAITTAVSLYVSPTGDDVLNSGTEQGSPFRTPERAIRWLSDKQITDSGFVTINFAAGIYDLEKELVFDHDQGNRVAFVGERALNLVLQYVSDYRTTGFTADGFAKYYSWVQHGITMSCARYSVANNFENIVPPESIPARYAVAGTGVVIEDFDLVTKSDYNPIYHYSAYPFHPRNNIARQGSLLGAHTLTGASGGVIGIQSTIRDDWFSIPAGNSSSWGRFYGNAQQGVCYISGSCLGNPADYNENQNNLWLKGANTLSGSGTWIKGHYLSSVPVGYYGLTATSGIPVGATANLVGASFPNSTLSGKTASFQTKTIDDVVVPSWYSATGGAGSFLNDGINFGPNYHEHALVNGLSGMGGSAGWGSVNTNLVFVRLIPTVFRRYGNILRIGSGGLRKIANIFFDGKSMTSHWKLIGSAEEGYSNKTAVYAAGSVLGFPVTNEPLNLGKGLFSEVGMVDFHVGFYANLGTRADIGKVSVSNCTYGVIANNKSVVSTTGSVCTGMASGGFCSFTSSEMVADRCLSSFSGQSLVSIRIKNSETDLNYSSFVLGQTFATPDGRIKGTIWDWDPRDKNLVIAVRVGTLEGGSAIHQ
jgi:hypothetical protein